jgi:diguanylate cyclase (GGDEF)-like protein/PAS domain S-box-containing protein
MLVENQNFYRELLQHMRDGVYFVDRDRRILYWNEGASRLTGYAAEEIVGRFCNDNILNHVDGCGRGLCEDGCPLTATVADGKGREVQVFLRHKSGNRVPVLVRVQPILGEDGSIEGAVEIFSDNSAQVEAERKIEEMRRMAFLDHLTQLPNRRYMELALKSAHSEFLVHHSPFGVLIVDVDRFKQINDAAGHSAGDRVLKEVGRTLADSLRPSDIVGRWGGDEFLAIVKHVDVEGLRRLADRCVVIESTVEVPVGEQERISISVSIGAGLICPGEGFEEAVERADRLLYASKSAGRNRATVE